MFIMSVSQTLPDVDIHILYHGTGNRMCLKWLARRNDIFHPHNPIWLSRLNNFIINTG